MAYAGKRRRSRRADISVNGRVAPSKPRLTPLAHRCAMTEALELAALPAAPDLAAVVAAWLGRLAGERRLSANTVEAYGRDARQFLAFLAERLGAPAGVGEFSALAPADLRAFLAHRRAEGIDPRSLQRALSALRSLARQVVRDGGAPASALGAVRAPKAARRLPRPLSAPDARAVASAASREGEAREPWILARDAAVLSLCYGAGPAHRRSAVDPPRRRADRRTRRGDGRRQGPQDALGAGDRAGQAGDRRLSRALPLYSQAAGAAVRRRQGRAAVAAHRPIGDGAAARRARPARQRHAARACAIPSPPTCWRAAAICAPSRSCSATRRCRPPRSTPRSTAPGSSPPTAPPTRAPRRLGARKIGAAAARTNVALALAAASVRFARARQRPRRKP